MVEVDRYQRLIVIGENALELAFAGFPHYVVDLFDRRVSFGDETQINSRDIDRRHTHRESVKFAVQFRQHEANCSCGTGLGRNLRHRGRTRAAQIGVVYVRQYLVVRVRVNRRHDAVLNTNLLMQGFDQWCETIGRARCIRNDCVG